MMSMLDDRPTLQFPFRHGLEPSHWPEPERDTHLVAGLLSTTLTVLAADPAVGKTNYAIGIAGALLNGDSQFLGREVRRKLDSVAFLCTDADGAHSVKRRMTPLITDPMRQHVWALDYPKDGEPDWGKLVDDVLALRAGLLVVDNLLGVVDDINDAREAQRLLRHLGDLADRGTAVLMLTHTAKPGAQGPAQGINAPIGSRHWTVPPRVKVSLTGREGTQRKLIKAFNNDAPFDKIDARLHVMDNAPFWTLWEDTPEPFAEARPNADVVWEHLADRILAEQPPGVTSLRALGNHYEADFGKSAYTIRSHIRKYVKFKQGSWKRVT